ncbi:phage holin family protein [Virgisporangium aurantiacum]|nr:alkaline phosphatase family protein [Virgisporangium aurantiacum]
MNVRTVRRRLVLTLRLWREWRPTMAWARSMLRSGATSFGVLAVTFWLLPGVYASGGPAALVELMVVLALVGMVMRWVLLGVAVLVGGIGVLALGTVLQAIVMYTGLLISDGVSANNFADAWVASWIAAILAATINWLADAGSDDVFLRQTLRQMARSPLDEPPNRPGVLIVQLDGLSEPLLNWAVKAGNLPNLGRWLRNGSHAMTGWHTGMPATTPASQAGIMHGEVGQVPAFRWYEKETQRLVVTNRPRDAADVEKRISNGRGLLADGGVSISNVFSGDAPVSLLTFSNASLPGRSARGYLSFVASPYGLARALVLSIGEMLKEIQQARRQRRRDVYPRVARHGAYVALRAVTNVVLRDLNVSLIAEQMSKGAPVIFCDFVDYDEVAHHAGPLRPEAMESLEGLDRVLGTLHRLADSAARRYEIVVLSDHGQSQGATFRQRYGETFEDVVTKLVHVPEDDGDPSADGGSNAEEWGRVNVLLTGMAHQRGVKGAAVRACAPEQRRDRLSAGRALPEGQPVVTVASGNLAMIYLTGQPHRLTLEDLDHLHPDLVPGLVRHPGVGFVVVESAIDGPVAIGEIGRHRLRDGHVDGIDPLLRYGPHAARDLLDHQGIAHVGDIVAVSRLDRGTEEVAAFEELVGSHGGIGGWQTDAVLVYPATWHREHDDIRGPDAVYRQLVDWLDELGLRAAPSAEPEPESVSV